MTDPRPSNPPPVMAPLMSCPFCGGAGSLHENDWCEPHEWNVFCTGCGCGMGSTDTKELAVSMWNRRPIPEDGY